ncbi:MAG: sodium:proline symporter, partial [Desulfuromonadales bacterium]|nr:sodium:proline symporter [Desulfuromonadales bacterium]NIR33925.1 sodium:proline symporter [Desulfuromonadales bacterium]NIS43945.1 sodium:proline symporter [Desulfuromonadales bacterium]
VSYTFLGGFLAVSWTDFFQGSLMLVALIAVPVMVIGEVGGWQEVTRQAARVDRGHLDAFSGMTVMG